MKLLFGLLIGIAISAIIVALYCALMRAGRPDNCNVNSCKEPICPKCKTGKDTFELDPKSDACPYISCLKNGKCAFYVPLD